MTITQQVLAAFYQAPQQTISGGELARQLNVSRTAVWAHIEELRQLGYVIEAQPHLGYRLVQAPDRLISEEIKVRLQTEVIGQEVIVFEETGSTNEVVLKLGKDGVREGVVVFAESQTRGRGRMGRTWISPRGKGLWFSVLLRPTINPAEITRVTILSAVSVWQAIEKLTGVRCDIKWPNDLLLRNRKVCGMLVEMFCEMDRVDFAVLGIGVDVNCRETDFPAFLQGIATSLCEELGGEPVNRVELAVEILQSLDRNYQLMRSNLFQSVIQLWTENSCTLGRRVRLSQAGRQIEGVAMALAEDGALLLRCDNGQTERVLSGEILEQ